MPALIYPHMIMSHHDLKRHVRSCFCSSDEAERIVANGQVWIIRKRNNGVNVDFFEKAIAHHKSIDRNHPDRLKTDVKRRLSRFSHNGFSCIVKEFIPRPWRPMLSDRRSWRSAAGVECFNLPATKYLAWKRERNRTSYILMEDLGSRKFSYELSQAVAEADWHTFLKLLRMVASLVAKMHLLGIYHRDLKTDNFMLKANDDGKDELYLIDLDAVSFHRQLSMRQISANFQQLACTLPKGTPLFQILRGTTRYRKLTHSSKRHMRHIFKHITLARDERFTQ